MPNSRKWYKGNLHMHSLWSDGMDFPEMIARWFKNHEYNFVAFTEHNRLQTGECWVTREPGTKRGKPMIDDGLVEAYARAFGEDWVEQRQRRGLTEVRLKTLDEYRHRLEEEGRFLLITGEEISTTTS